MTANERLHRTSGFSELAHQIPAWMAVPTTAQITRICAHHRRRRHAQSAAPDGAVPVRMGSRLTATDRDCPFFVARYGVPVLGARWRLAMKVAVAGGDVRIGWAKRVAAAAEAGPASVRSVHDYLVCSLSGCHSGWPGERSPISEAGRSRACDGLIQWPGLARAEAAGPHRCQRELAPARRSGGRPQPGAQRGH
jgi:hypothetical protein